ncbi:hypothetical protein NPIL_39731 [Nephila pilipes]|uniref:Uncharacterized protein n=1 Tax=Nephila pilipes TaxID=299642 RepID=A0A8X6NLB5_NEPPI|nr:hypothetical protein NPIL_39731 [Nephila pilipes]
MNLESSAHLKRSPCFVLIHKFQFEGKLKTRINTVKVNGALAYAIEVQSHLELRIKLEEKYPHTEYGTNLETNQKKLKLAKVKTAEIQSKLELLLPCPVQNCPIHLKVVKKCALDQNNGENNTFVSPKKTVKQPKLNKFQ